MGTARGGVTFSGELFALCPFVGLMKQRRVEILISEEKRAETDLFLNKHYKNQFKKKFHQEKKTRKHKIITTIRSEKSRIFLIFEIDGITI